MGTIFPPHSLSQLFDIKASSSGVLLSPSLQRKSSSLFSSRPIISSLRKNQTLSHKPSSPACTSWLTHAQHGLAALAISLALNFSPLLHTGNALASEFDVLNEGPPKESYVVDDAGVLSRVTRSDLKQLLSDLESRKNFHINFITVRKLTSKADAFEYADQVLERWYPSVEEGNNKGIVVLVTSQKEGAVSGGPAFVQAVGENILDATVSENLPGGGKVYPFQGEGMAQAIARAYIVILRPLALTPSSRVLPVESTFIGIVNIISMLPLIEASYV